MILVTGSTGFLGSELVRQLTSHQANIRAIKRKKSNIPPALKEYTNIEWVEADVLDFFSLQEAFKDVKQVYHCAACVSFNVADKKKVHHTNVTGTANVVNLCLDNDIEKLVHVSSVAALGESKFNQPVSEKNHWEYDGKQSQYAISKYESEMEVFRGIAEGLNAVIVNPSIIIGSGLKHAVFADLFEAVKNGLRYYPNGACNLVDVKDVARIMIALMESNYTAERYIINAESWTYDKLLTEISNQLDVKPPHIELKSWMMPAILLNNYIKQLIGSKANPLTKQLLRNAFSKKKYENAKIKNAIEIDFRPIEQTIASMIN